ncbi:MAG: DHH family phosphoesterase [Desulfobulbaceae bacterium]|jgi:nanoRNase/pAp phosphatase (c-di-AMP/oligoRNAs hydrolase)|nr:DHH family phosphoesterase [Desulfobulbaceae bacterium]
MAKTLRTPVPPPPKNYARGTARERLQQFWDFFGKEDAVLVVINADPDALASAMAIKRLLRYRVKYVAIAHPNEIRRMNNVTMVQRLKIPLERLGNVKINDFSKIVMVDSQPNHLPCFEKLKVDVIIDHHPIVVEWSNPFVDIRPDYGATASIMVEYLRAADIKLSTGLATALFYAIKVDTSNFEKNAHLADRLAFRYLFDLANRDLMRKFELTDLRRSELRYFTIGLHNLKYSKNRYYSHIGRVPSPDVLVIVADFLNHVGGIDWVFVSGIHNDKLVVIFRCDGYRKNAGKLAARSLGALGSAGGHKQAARGEVPLKNLAMGEKEFTSESLQRLIIHHI